MILDEIMANKYGELVQQKRQVPLAMLRARAEAVGGTRGFAAALVRDHVAVIGEIKRASPSKGELRAINDPGHLAQTYATHGAAAISVLTDKRYFHGSLADLQGVGAAVEIPVLRKDFIVDEYQIYESRAAQADAILLIVRLLSTTLLYHYISLARSLGMDALVEIHDERELEFALAADARLIGINNRNLGDFTVDRAMTERLAPRIPAGNIVVSESGVFARADVERAAHAGAHAVLVGEALIRAEDVGRKVTELASVKRTE